MNFAKVQFSLTHKPQHTAGAIAMRAVVASSCGDATGSGLR